MRTAVLLVLAAVALLALLAAPVAATSRHARRSSIPVSSFPRSRGPPVSMEDASLRAAWSSVCVSSGPARRPAVSPLPSPLVPPPLDEATSQVVLEVKAGLHKECVAWGYHNDDIEAVGWSYLYVESNAAFPDLLQSRAAGLLEGALCQERIYQLVQTEYPALFINSKPSAAVLQFLNESQSFHLGMIGNVATVDPYWAQVQNIYTQLAGLFEGYALAVPASEPDQALSWFHLLAMQMDVDIGDVQTAVGLNSPLATEEERARAHEKLYGNGTVKDNADIYTHCSVLIKPTADYSDLMIGHDTWSGFSTMLRTYKLYVLPLKVSTGSVSVHMSSYPGYLFSSDDFYQLSPSMLTVTETTNDLYNPALFDLVEPGSVLLWLRTLVANRLATSGQQWAELVAAYNSGTCSNQWMIVDHKRFTPGQPTLQSDLLWAAEQMPGQFVSHDVTPILQEQGYWSSFNIPYFERTFLTSGYTTGCKSPLGDFVCGYKQNFRFLLFQEQQPSAVDLQSFKHVMMYNEWQSNPLQRSNAQYAISARYDLRPEQPKAFGGIDGKITLDSWMRLPGAPLRVEVYSGPTTQTQKPFCWTGQWATQRPVGQPECFDFPWVQYQAPTADMIEKVIASQAQNGAEEAAAVVSATTAPVASAASALRQHVEGVVSSAPRALRSAAPAVFTSDAFKSALGKAYPAFWNFLYANPPADQSESTLRDYFAAYAKQYLSAAAAKAGERAVNDFFGGGGDSGHKKLSTGEIIGIAVGGGVGLLLLIIVLRKMCKKTDDSENIATNYQRGLLDD